MAIYPSIINPGAPVKSSIPLAERSFGVGLGFKAQSSSQSNEDKEVLIELSRSALLRGSKLQNSQSAVSSILSASPLSQALDTLADISKRIASLQEGYADSASASAASDSFKKELNSLATEFKRITSSDIFKTFEDTQTSGTTSNLGSLGFYDAGIKAVVNSNDQSRIDSLNNGINGLKEISFDNILSDSSITKNIQNFIATIRGALKPEAQKSEAAKGGAQAGNSVLIPVPQASLQTAAEAKGLTVSLLGFSNKDLIRAAASHVNIDATNVLILTFNAPEPETEEEKKEREDKAQMIEIQNPVLEDASSVNQQPLQNPPAAI